MKLESIWNTGGGKGARWLLETNFYYPRNRNYIRANSNADFTLQVRVDDWKLNGKKWVKNSKDIIMQTKHQFKVNFVFK